MTYMNKGVVRMAGRGDFCNGIESITPWGLSEQEGQPGIRRGIGSQTVRRRVTVEHVRKANSIPDDKNTSLFYGTSQVLARMST
jgi:hypothetical protein